MTGEQYAGLAIAVILMLAGLAGSVLPGIPGAPLIFAVAVGHKLYFGQQSASILTLVILFILMVLSIAVDFLASTMGAKKMGATWRGVVGAIVGAFVGLFFNIPGLILGPVIGAFVFELAGGREWKDSAKAGAGAMIGFFVGLLGKLVCCSLMIGIFLASTLWNSGKLAKPPPDAVAVAGTVQSEFISISQPQIWQAPGIAFRERCLLEGG